jgi:hypothetical protein
MSVAISGTPSFITGNQPPEIAISRKDKRF